MQNPPDANKAWNFNLDNLDEEMSSWSGSGGESVTGEDGRGERQSYDKVGALQLHLQVYKGSYTVSAQI